MDELSFGEILRCAQNDTIRRECLICILNEVKDLSEVCF